MFKQSSLQKQVLSKLDKLATTRNYDPVCLLDDLINVYTIEDLKPLISSLQYHFDSGLTLSNIDQLRILNSYISLLLDKVGR